MEEHKNRQGFIHKNGSINAPNGKLYPLNLLLAAGLLLIVLGLFLLVSVSTSATKVFSVRAIVMLALGTLGLFLALGITKNDVLVFMGLFCLLSGIFILFVDVHIIPYTLRELWPIIVIEAGVSLFPAGLYRLSRMRSVYLFPAISLVVLGILLLPFSLHIKNLSFAQFIGKW